MWCYEFGWSFPSTSGIWINHEKELGTRGPAPWEGVWKLWHQGRWRTDLCVFITCPISLMLFLGQLICWDPSDLGYRLCSLLPVTPCWQRHVFLREYLGTQIHQEFQWEWLAWKAALSLVHLSSYNCTNVLMCVKRQIFSGDVFVHPLSELHALKGVGWNPGAFQLMRILLLSISISFPLAFLCFDGNTFMVPSLWSVSLLFSISGH